MLFKIIQRNFFAKNEVEHLGFRRTRKGIMPLPDKVETIMNIAMSTIK